MSWGGSEYAGQLADDRHFSDKRGVVYVASAGDTNMLSYPATSPHVIAIGGTRLIRNSSNAFQNEIVWNDANDPDGDNGETGGGPSFYEPRPAYQTSVSTIVGATRGVPDVSYDASVDSGVWVLAYGYWNIVGGTSLGAPATAGVINAANALVKAGSTQTTQGQLITLYNTIATPPATPVVRDIVSGTCGTEIVPPSTPEALSASTGYDLCSGVGTPQGYGAFGAAPGARPKSTLPVFEQISNIGGTISITGK